MAYWTRATVGERLAQLVEDVHRVGELALALDSRVGGSVGLPPEMLGTWAGFGELFWREDARFPGLWDHLRAVQDRQRHWDDSDLAWGRDEALATYELAHRGLGEVEPWATEGHPAIDAGWPLRRALQLCEDEAHRLVCGFGDLRRNERRSRVS